MKTMEEWNDGKLLLALNPIFHYSIIPAFDFLFNIPVFHLSIIPRFSL
jgi:hypothetical protein